MIKRAHALKGYASTYNIETLKFFNPELQSDHFFTFVVFPIYNNVHPKYC